MYCTSIQTFSTSIASCAYVHLVKIRQTFYVWLHYFLIYFILCKAFQVHRRSRISLPSSRRLLSLPPPPWGRRKSSVYAGTISRVISAWPFESCGRRRISSTWRSPVMTRIKSRLTRWDLYCFFNDLQEVPVLSIWILKDLELGSLSFLSLKKIVKTSYTGSDQE